MQWLNDTPIRTRLIGGFLIVAALVALVGVNGLITKRDATEALRTVVVDRVQPLDQLKSISDLYAVHVVDASHKLYAGSAGWDATLRAIREARGEAAGYWDEYMATHLTEEEARLADVVRSRMAVADPVLDRLEGIVEARDEAALAGFISDDLYPTIDPLTAAIGDLVTLQLDVAEEVFEVSKAASDRSQVFSIAMIVIAALLALGLGILLSRSITRPLEATVAAMKRQSRGIVTDRLELGRKDEVGEMADAFDAFNDKLESFLVRWLNELAEGDLDVDVPEQSGDDMLAPAVRRIRNSLRELTSQTSALIDAAREGRLDTRADASRVRGAYAGIVNGVNETLDAVIEPINEASGVLDRVAARDMTARVTGEYRGDHAKIKRALNEAVEKLESALEEVSGASEQVASASQQITASSQELAEGTGEQASSLEEVSSSLQELASMAAQNTGNAREGSSITESARNATAQGVERMGRLADAMNRIKQSSDSTAKVINTIDEIAYWMPQTCAYRRLAENRPLPEWHPLITGEPESVHRAGVSVRGLTLSEFDVPEEEWEDHIIEEPGT